MLSFLRLEYSTDINVSRDKISVFRAFVQGMLNRILVGELRYGSPHKRQKYMSRLLKETLAYKRSGNAEHLINIANYCILEWMCPEHPKHHFDNTVESATRHAEESH